MNGRKSDTVVVSETSVHAHADKHKQKKNKKKKKTIQTKEN